MPVIGQYQSIPTRPQGQPHMQQQIQQCPHLQQLQQDPHEQMQQYFHAQQVPVPQHQGQYAPQQRLLTQPHHEQQLPQQQFTMQQPQFAQQPPQPQHHQFPAPQNPHHQYALPNQGQRQSQQGPQSTHNPPRAPNASPTTISRPQNPPIATQWLQHAKQDLQNPPPIMAPGIPPQHRIPLEKLTRMLKPNDILWVRSLHPNDRLKVYKKMQDAGRMMRGLDPNHQAYQSGWKSICDINERQMDEEREWYSKWVSDDPGIQAQLNVEFLQICVGQMQPWPLPTQPPAPQHPPQGSNDVGLLALSNTSARMVQGIQHKTASTQGSGAQRSQLIAHVGEQRPPQAHHSASVGTSATTSVLPQADDDDVLFLSSTTLSPLEARIQQHTATPPDHSSANTITPDLLLPHAPENKKKRKAPTENGDAAPKKKTKKQQAEEEQIRAGLQAQAKAREQAEAEAQAKAQELEDEDPLDKAMREGFEQAKKVEKAEKREEASKKATAEKKAFEEEYEKDPQRIEAWYLLGHPSRRAKDPMWQKMNAWNKHKRSAVPQHPPPFNRAEQGLASKSPEEAEQPQQEIQEEPPRAVKKPRKTTAEKSPAQQEALTPAAQSTSCPKETQLPAEQPPKAAKAPKKKAQKGPAKQSAATPRAQTPAPVVSAPVSAQVSQGPMSLPVSPLQISQPAAPVVKAPTLEPAEPETEDFNLEQALFEGLEELEETPATSLHLQLPPQPAKAASSAAKQAVAQQTAPVLQASKPKEPPKTAPFQQASTPQQAQAPAVPFGPAPLPQTEEVVPKPAAPTPQSSMAPKPKCTLPGPSAKQRAGEAVLEFMHKRNVATDQKRDLREDERLVVGGIDVERLNHSGEISILTIFIGQSQLRKRLLSRLSRVELRSMGHRMEPHQPRFRQTGRSPSKTPQTKIGRMSI
jgi:hypothetical protein